MPPSMTPSRVPKLRPERLDVAHLPELGCHGALLHAVGVALEHVALASGFDCREGGLGRHHAAQHGVVAALDARHVHEAGGATDQRPAGEDEARDRLKAAFGQRAGAVADALAAFEMRA